MGVWVLWFWDKHKRRKQKMTILRNKVKFSKKGWTRHPGRISAIFAFFLKSLIEQEHITLNGEDKAGTKVKEGRNRPQAS